jgi:hypothetical protein
VDGLVVRFVDFRGAGSLGFQLRPASVIVAVQSSP